MPVTTLATVPGSLPLSNKRYEAFAFARAHGGVLAQCGRAAGFKIRTHTYLSRVNCKPEVKARVAYLKQEIELQAFKLEKVRSQAAKNNPTPGAETEEFMVSTCIAAIGLCLSRGDIKGLLEQQKLLARIRGIRLDARKSRAPTKAEREQEALAPTPPPPTIEDATQPIPRVSLDDLVGDV